MTDQPGTTTAPKPTKYTILLDQRTRAYQRHLRRNTDINFSDLIRAAIAKVASDKDLEAELFRACGGGYDDVEEPENPTGFWMAPEPTSDGPTSLT